jgi:NTE family protein
MANHDGDVTDDDARLATDVVRYAGAVDLRVIPSLCPLTVSPLDCGHTASLIVRARESTRDWLTHPTDNLAVLTPHTHA